ncbi:TPA: hypothetical protein ACI7IN_004265 [Escherichia coli]|nr:hypothetical protein [Escherichia coli]
MSKGVLSARLFNLIYG